MYCNGITDRQAFDGKLEFDVKIIPYEGDDSWVEEVIVKCKNTLEGEVIPDSANNCDYCRYRQAIARAEAPMDY